MTENPLRFAGYAGLFDIADADHDTIRKGAFATSLARRTVPVPLLWQHRPNEPIGEIETAFEDDRGLAVIGRIDRLECLAAAMLKRGDITGLSFGYRAWKAQPTHTGRELLGIDLFEVSLVTHPLQHGARVHLIA
ncbi:MAG: HK97 family phage prohead protease [Pseudomonadota bacterium]